MNPAYVKFIYFYFIYKSAEGAKGQERSEFIIIQGGNLVN